MGTVSSLNLINGGLDVQTIVDNLMYVERAPVRRLQSQTTLLQSKVTAFQTLNTKISALLDKANRVLFNGETAPFQVPYSFEDRLPDSIFGMRTASSSDETVLTATAGQGAATPQAGTGRQPAEAPATSANHAPTPTCTSRRARHR